VRFRLDPKPLLEGAEEYGGQAKNLPRAIRSALGSVGWLVKNKLYAATGKMPPLNPHSAVLTLAMARAASGKGGGWVYKFTGRGKNRKRVKYFTRVGSASRGTGGATDTPPFRRARNAIRYRVREDGAVQIGFLRGGRLIWGLSRSIAEQAEPLAETITPKMRRFFFAAGLPLKDATRTLFRPARPWLEPVLEQNGQLIRATFATKFFEALARYAAGSGRTA
jgi:hypothetical protein